jgi:hypothetical protein
MAEYGRDVWDAGQAYKLSDARNRVQMRDLVGAVGDTPARPKPATGAGPVAKNQATTVSPYDPTLLDRLGSFIAGEDKNGFRQKLATMVTGSTGLSGGGASLADATPLGTLQGLQDVYRAASSSEPGELATAAMGVLPGGRLVGKGARSAGRIADDLLNLGRTYNSGVSNIKLRTPLEEMTADFHPDGSLAPHKVAELEKLQGGTLIPLIGDRTRAGGTLTGVNDQALAYPVNLEGGHEFMRSRAAQGPDQSVWASHGTVTKGIQDHVNRVADKTGRDVYGVYTGMQPTSGDFSHMVADTLLAQMPAAREGVPRQVLQSFDDRLRSGAGLENGGMPDWAGLTDLNLEAARAQLMGRPGLRKDFIAAMETAPMQAAGMPEVGAARWATNHPDLGTEKGLPTGAAIARMRPGAEVNRNPAVPHTTYATQLPGDYLGGVESIPRELMFPDWHAGRRAAGKSTATDQRAFSMGRVEQPANQEWLDRIMRHYEQQRGR